MRRFAVLLLGAGVALGVWLVALRLADRPVPPTGGLPEPIEPFGLVARADLAFSWAPVDRETPTLVEVVDPLRRPVWRSPLVRGSRWAPDDDARRALPAGDLYWRPVAVPDDGPERPGPLAAFTLR